MRNKLLVILTAFYALTALALETNEGQIRSSIYDVEAQISKNIEERIIQFVGTENIWVATHISVSIDKLQSKLRLDAEGDKPDKRQKYDDLPGLNVDPDGVFVSEDSVEKIILLDNGASSVPAATILSYATMIKVTVYHKATLDRKVERVIRSLVEEKLGSLKIPVEVKFDNHKAKALKETDFHEAQKVKFEPQSFAQSFHEAVVLSYQKFLDTHIISPLKTGFVLIAAVALLVLGLASFFLTKTLLAINASLIGLAKVVNNQHSEPRSFARQASGEAEVKEQETEQTVSENGSEEGDACARILQIYEGYREVVKNYFTYCMDKMNFHDIWALSQLLGEKIILENENLTSNKNYKHYKEYLRSNLTQVSSGQDYQKIYQKLMGLMLYPDVFFLNSIKGQADKVSPELLGEFFQTLQSSEKGVVCEVLDSYKLASLINKGLVRTDEISDVQGSGFDIQGLRKLDQKLTTFTSKLESESDKTMKILMMLNQFQYESFLMKHNLSEKFQLSNLYLEKQAEADDYFKGLGADELCCLLPMLSQDMEENVLKALPEIKLARVMQGQRTITPASQELMQMLYKLLLSNGQEEELLREIAAIKRGPHLRAVGN